MSNIGLIFHGYQNEIRRISKYVIAASLAENKYSPFLIEFRDVRQRHFSVLLFDSSMANGTVATL